MSSPKKLVRKVVKGRVLRDVEQGFRKSRGLAWRARYGFPAKGMRVIAVTGTNGKTTSCSYISEVLKAGGYKVAVYTTAFLEMDGKREPNRSHMTVKSQKDVQGFLRKAKSKQVDFVVLEVTSNALDQHRIDGVKVEIAVVTNLTQDHLDYHGTMEEYARVKSLLLRDYGAKWAVLNGEDKWFEYFRDRSTAQVFSFGKESGLTARLQNIKTTATGSGVVFATQHAKLSIKTSLIGEFNLYNASVAVSVGLILGIDVKAIALGVATLNDVPGRMESIEAGQDFTVLVDYAYTPDALLQTLSTLQQIAPGQIRIVFGATGDRDKDKRPLMGEVVAEQADHIYLTDDETYTEDAKTIRDAVYSGIKRKDGAGKTQVFDDRLDAIKKAFKDAKKGDIVILAGLGHEDYRNMGGKKLPWDEREVAQKLLTD